MTQPVDKTSKIERAHNYQPVPNKSALAVTGLVVKTFEISTKTEGPQIKGPARDLSQAKAAQATARNADKIAGHIFHETKKAK